MDKIFNGTTVETNGVRSIAGGGTGAATAEQARINLGITGAGVTSYNDLTNKPVDATTAASGFMSAADKTKLDGVATGATAYTHPTTDGNLHVPATSTTNDGKVLKAGSTAGSLSWGTLTATDVGLGNCDNTTDLLKPISTATQTALDGKVSNGGGAAAIRVLTSSQYSALTSIDSNTIYIII